MKTQARQSGAVLAAVILGLLGGAVLGAAALTLAISARYQRLHAGIGSRAFYLAESGVSFAKVFRQNNPGSLPAGLFTLSNGDQFQITSSTNGPLFVVQSTGIANPGSALEGRRRITVEVTPRHPNPNGEVLPIGFDLNEDSIFDAGNWTAEDLTPRFYSTGPSGGQLALDLKGEEGQIYLNTSSANYSNLGHAWRLQYDAQVKVSPFEPGVGFSQHYMLGLSFRVAQGGVSGYGLSFFRSLPDNRPPDWVARLPVAFQSLRGTNVYLVLWYRQGDVLSLLNYKQLLPAEHLVYTGDGQSELSDYSTLLIMVRERVVGPQHETLMQAYVQSTHLYPLWTSSSPTNALWPGTSPVFPSPVVWANGQVTNVDTRLTSTNTLYQNAPEIGLHVYYDSAGANKKFMDDFAVRGLGALSGGGELIY